MAEHRTERRSRLAQCEIERSRLDRPAPVVGKQPRLARLGGGEVDRPDLLREGLERWPAAGAGGELDARVALGAPRRHRPLPDGEPEQAAYRDYRRWAFESAALDLALRQAGASLGDVLGREPNRSVRRRRRARSLDGWLELYPGLRFKLDPTPDWTDELVAELAARGDVDVVDLKGAYHGTAVDNPPNPELYRRVAEASPTRGSRIRR